MIDWNLIDKSDYLSAMERRPVNDLEISYLISNTLTDKISDCELYMKGIDVSYFYEGYSEYIIDDL
ncbi:cell filamentation protein Fic [Enterococcus mundtii CRL35]|nr:cell filamentation protein Fic [Enterococcus mundtii CRL35]